MTIPTIEPIREHLHGAFHKDLPPILTVQSGDVVRFRTLDVGWGLEPPVDWVKPRRKIEPRGGDKDNGPAMCGPIAVAGATPGSTLEIHIRKVMPGSWGCTWAGNLGFNRVLHASLGLGAEERLLTLWDIDVASMTATSHAGCRADVHAGVRSGVRVALSPFLGTLGVCPAGEGFHPGWFPHAGGGNMDCKEITEGSVLYVPVAVDGALVSLGDGHAVQGHGEIAGSALECPMDCVELCFIVRTDFPIRTPHVYHARGWCTLGFDRDLDVAIAQATSAVLDLIMRDYGVSRIEAITLASLCVDLHLTQLVNEVRGVHAYLPHHAITRILSSPSAA